ncbi:hypothetical protein [Chelativorans salis]|uniref:Flagellar protein n=1 Tax=Chelativorans salis TaxID=2978478 RepID=A0ABT2LT99_9HYPH|nr:hypothetical protein [Chelativorans sp. EGI FJ00035]MCT7377581.1 hypothetical protein [Chelativorans sp. EGI FJ00035]
MTDKLAGLVLPDATPVEDLAEQATKNKRKIRFGRRKPPRTGGGDWLTIGCGIGLAVVCALFPWYIFFNQEAFGIRPLQFSGQPGGFGADSLAARSELVGERIPLAADSFPQLDFIPTGTVPSTPPFDEDDLPEQPFPGDRRSFRLVDAGNGRAMIEDDDGFWIVERGSPLPDGSRVANILRRDNTWILVTSEDAEIAVSR